MQNSLFWNILKIDMYGQRIKELRIEKGWSQRDLAKELNIAQITVSKYEREKLDLGTALIIQLTRIFHVSSDYILGIEDETGAKT